MTANRPESLAAKNFESQKRQGRPQIGLGRPLPENSERGIRGNDRKQVGVAGYQKNQIANSAGMSTDGP